MLMKAAFHSLNYAVWSSRRIRRKGRERDLILIEHLLRALDATGHIPILYLVLQQPAREYVEETREER